MPRELCRGGGKAVRMIVVEAGVEIDAAKSFHLRVTESQKKRITRRVFLLVLCSCFGQMPNGISHGEAQDAAAHIMHGAARM